jgi:hypothetical protein
MRTNSELDPSMLEVKSTIKRASFKSLVLYVLQKCNENTLVYKILKEMAKSLSIVSRSTLQLYNMYMPFYSSP